MNSADINQLSWDFGTPSYSKDIIVKLDHIDVMGHTNNVVYVGWLEDVAWGHSKELGLDWARYREFNRAMVARRHEVDYLAPTFSQDHLILGTWIAENDEKISITRRYQLIRPKDGTTVLRGCTKWVCVALDSGKLKRMPSEFINAYAVTVSS